MRCPSWAPALPANPGRVFFSARFPQLRTRSRCLGTRPSRSPEAPRTDALLASRTKAAWPNSKPPPRRQPDDGWWLYRYRPRCRRVPSHYEPLGYWEFSRQVSRGQTKEHRHLHAPHSLSVFSTKNARFCRRNRASSGVDLVLSFQVF